MNRTNNEQPNRLLELVSATWLRYGFLFIGVIGATVFWVSFDNRLKRMEASAQESKEAHTKYVDRINLLEKDAAVTQNQYDEIIRRLQRIETKIDQ